MADTAKFVVKLKDDVSGPAGKAESAIRGAAAAFLAYKAASIATAGAINLATRAIKTNSTIFTLNQLTHHRGAEAFDEVSKMAAQFGLDIDATTKQYANFLKLQFTPEAAKNMIKLGADMQALGNSAEDVQGIFMAMGQIKSKGKLQAEELLQLAERGVSGMLVKKHVARLMGVAQSEVEKLQQAGKVSGDVGLQAIEAALNEKLGQKKAGESGKKFVEETMGGAVAAAKEQGNLLWINLVRNFEPGLAKGINGALTAIRDFGQSKQGARVIEMMSSAMTKLGEGLELILPLFAEVGGELLDAFIGGFNDAEDAIAQVIGPNGIASGEEWVSFLRESLIPAARTIGDVLGMAASAFLTMGRIAGAVFTTISMGIAGLGQMISKAWEIGNDIGRAMLNGIKGALGIASPSKELKKVGVWSGRGFEDGLAKAMPSDIGPNIGSTNQIAGAASRLGGSVARSGGGISVGDVVIQVSGAGSPDQVAAATLAAFEGQLGSILTRYSEEAAA